WVDPSRQRTSPDAPDRRSSAMNRSRRRGWIGLLGALALAASVSAPTVAAPDHLRPEGKGLAPLVDAGAAAVDGTYIVLLDTGAEVKSSQRGPAARSSQVAAQQAKDAVRRA